MFRHVFGSDEVADLVMKVIGEIEPIGETHTDDARLVHLQMLLNTLDILIDEVMIDVLPCKSRHEYSMQRAGKEAFKWVKEKSEQFMEEVTERRAVMYECFHCGEKAVIWDGDFSFEDYCEEGEGIIHECHCTNCGARITYRISLEENIKEEEE